MCDFVFRVQDCNNPLDIQNILPGFIEPGLPLTVGSTLSFYDNTKGEFICYQILELGVANEGCTQGGLYPILTPFVTNYSITAVCDDCNDIEVCGCPEGYSLDINGDCVQTISTPADYSGVTVDVTEASNSASYSKFGMRLYDDLSNYNLPLVSDGPDNSTWKVYQDNGFGVEVFPLINSVQSLLWGSETAPCQTLSFGGRLNTTGIACNLQFNKQDLRDQWIASNGLSPDQGLEFFAALDPTVQLAIVDSAIVGFEFCIDVPETKQYLIGTGGDNEVLFYLDNVLQVYLRTQKKYDADGVVGSTTISTKPFNYWHVFPITLTAGQHIIKLQGINENSIDSFGAEIYDLTLQELQAGFTGTCDNLSNDLDPYTIFSTKNYLGQAIPDLSSPGEWSCPDGTTPDECGGIPVCTTTLKVDPIPCCYEIDPCDNPGNPVTISLADGQPELTIDNVYTFLGDVSIEGGCYTVLSKLECPGSELINITIGIDYQTTDCQVCIPCYELTDCKDSENTLIIKWDPTSPVLSENTIYVFDFDTTKCWTVLPLIPPCTGPQYSDANIVEEFTKCEDCLAPCFKIVDCVDDSIVYSDSASLINYVGQIIKWNDGVEDKCGTVFQYICREDVQPVQPITVINCYAFCNDCLPPPVLPAPSFDLKPRIVKPGYNTPACSPEYYDKVKCKLSEALYQHMASRRFGIEFCCELDLQKWEIKNEILDIESTKYPDIDCTKPCPDTES